MNIQEFKTEELIEVLEPFQCNLVKTLLEEHDETEAIRIWIDVTGPDYTATFGGDKRKNPLKRIKEEFDKFILEDEEYKDQIKELKNYTTITKFFIVSFLSSALARTLGVVAAVIAPLIVLLLGIIGKVGLNAYRKSLKEKIEQQDKENSENK